VKLFVTASAEIRARRRWLELGGDDAADAYDDVLKQVRDRDERDMNRADAPMKPAEDAVMLDTSEMSIDDAVARALALIAERL
jgi:cytidylate kinase